MAERKPSLTLNDINARPKDTPSTVDEEKIPDHLKQEAELISLAVERMQLPAFTEDNFPGLWHDAPDYFVGKMAIAVNTIVNNCNGMKTARELKNSMATRKIAAELFFVVQTCKVYGEPLPDPEEYEYQGIFEAELSLSSQVARIDLAVKFGLPSILEDKRLTILYEDLSKDDREYLKLISKRSKKTGLKEISAEIEGEQNFKGFHHDNSTFDLVSNEDKKKVAELLQSLSEK